MPLLQRSCRICGQPTSPILPFGTMPLANALVAPGVPLDQEERFPLTLTFCPACALVQLAETIDPEKLFRHYVYLSSNSPAFVQHAKSLVQRMIGEQGLDRTSRRSRSPATTATCSST